MNYTINWYILGVRFDLKLENDQTLLSSLGI